jgi:regulatory protein
LAKSYRTEFWAKQPKREGRVNVYIDDEFSFGIDLDSFVLLDLRVGQEMSEEDIEKAKNTSDFQKNLEKVYRFAMVRQRAEKEFVDYFKRKKINPSFHLKLLKKLKHLNLQ